MNTKNIVKMLYLYKLEIILTHKAPDRIIFTHGVRPSGKQKHATTLKHNVSWGPGGSLNSQDLYLFGFPEFHACLVRDILFPSLHDQYEWQLRRRQQRGRWWRNRQPRF